MANEYPSGHWLAKAQAPFTDDQILSLNEYQSSGVFHEFTCGGENCREAMVAQRDGWVCPTCGYNKQNWAWEWMANWGWKSSVVIPNASSERASQSPSP